jgi:uncharacterized membrane protein (UPF0136 family)
MGGGGPWGFRLYGGDSDPLVVAKLRKKSKASEAGLQEGDVLLAINRYSCDNMTHQIAMALVDQSSILNFEVLRGVSDRNAIHAAIQALGSEFAAAPKPPPARAPAASAPQAAAPAPAPSSMVNGVSSTTHREAFQDGNRQVTTETTTQKFGGTTITKVRREMTQQQQQPTAWQPASLVPQPRKFVTAPPQVDQRVDKLLSSGDQFQQSPSQQYGKENVSPNRQAYIPPSQQPTQQNMFKIKKVQAGSKAMWQPSFVPDLPNRPAPRPENLVEDEPEFYHEPEPVQYQQQAEPEPMQMDLPEAYQNRKHVWEAPQDMDDVDIFTYSDDGHPRKPLLDQSEDEYTRMMINMIIEGEMKGESPNTVWRRKKKVYADSAFYDDPEHKYPTIEEQIKMARKVALSLESPANQLARGHKMFMKRKQKAYKWVAAQDGQPAGFQEIPEHEEHEVEEKYYNPDPWQIRPRPHTWQPSGGPPMLPQVSPPQPAASFAPPPPAPPVPDLSWKQPAYKLPPGMSFRLAEDLHGMKGKGAKLFAKRKAKAEQWVVQSDDTVDTGPRRTDPAFLSKVTGGLSDASPPMMPSAPTRPRLQEMIEPPKAAMTPWDAMANYGTVEKAFTHIDSYMDLKKGAAPKSVVAKTVKAAASVNYEPNTKTYGGDIPAAFNSSRSNGGAPLQGFRPVNFKAPTPASQTGVFNNSPRQFQPSSQPPAMEVSENDGYCDL